MNDTEQEEWKDIIGYEGFYKISSLGRMKSLERIEKNGSGGFRLRREYIVKTSLGKSGYLQVNLSLNGIKKNFLIHRLVLETFCPIDIKKSVNHKDGNKINNRLNNLEWVTHKENTSHAIDIGLIKSGEKHWRAKLTSEQIDLIRELLKTQKSIDIARKFNVHKNTIHNIKFKKSWRRYVALSR